LCGSRRTTGKSIPLKVAGFQVTLTGRFTPSPDSLVHRLRKAGTVAVPQHPLAVLDEDGPPLGEYFADIFVENRLIVEIKACKALSAEHVAQLQLMQPFIHAANFSY
jgi:hypothetical protein